MSDGVVELLVLTPGGQVHEAIDKGHQEVTDILVIFRQMVHQAHDLVDHDRNDQDEGYVHQHEEQPDDERGRRRAAHPRFLQPISHGIEEIGNSHADHEG